MSRSGKTPVRLSQNQFERWLDSPEARACVYRRGRPGQQRPLVVEAARHFGVERRTIERALARIARRQRLLAEHQPVDAATAGMLLDAAKSFVVGRNTTRDPSQIRHAQERPAISESEQGLASAAPPSRQDALGAIRELLAQGVFSLSDVLDEHPRSHDGRASSEAGQLAAVGLRAAVQPAAARPLDPLQLSIEALLDALDAYASSAPSIPPAVQAHVDGLRQALQEQAG